MKAVRWSLGFVLPLGAVLAASAAEPLTIERLSAEG